ncbi:hypothetical protein LTR10_008247 [Elasticomyces elasticus]|nr:hypothetical protein LTR10_008247 [Elasticomyces elasticus]KAK4967123.1 hypothetical protein LTR42_010471 [Elasticomyces elasticus]
MPVELISLPHEVNEVVLEYLEPADILSLRLTSKHLATANFDWFQKWCMVRRIHLWTRHGLQSLIDITDPDRNLLQRLEHISFAVQTVRQPPVKRASSGASYNGSNALLHYNRLGRWKCWEQEKVPDDETGLSGLMTIFNNIRLAQNKQRARRSITVRITARPIDPNLDQEQVATMLNPLGWPYGTRTLLDRIGHEMVAGNLAYGNSEPVCDSLVRAINTSGCSIRCLDIEKSYYTGLQKPQAFQTLRDGNSVCWEALTSFNLTLSPPRVVRSARERAACLNGLAAFMRATKNLERLKIYEPLLLPASLDKFQQFRARDIWAGIPYAAMPLRLKHIELRNTAAPERAYTMLLWYQRSSIRSLEMVQAVQSEGIGWYGLFTVLLEASNLEELELKSLSPGHDSIANIAKTGRDVIKEALQRAIANATE